MKIVFIYPPHPYLAEETQQPPLGILYTAAILIEAGYDVRYVSLAGINEEDWLSSIPEADIYGVQVAYLDLEICDRIAEILKKERNGTMVMGGIHPTTMPSQIDFKRWDSAVIGEGEKSILELVKDYERGELKNYYSSSFVKNLDTIPFPARELLPVQGGISFFSKKNIYYDGGSTSIITSRGCPYDCAFCGSKSMWKKQIRFRSPENIYLEMRHVIDSYNIRQFRFQDDTITLNKKRLFVLSEMLQNENIAFLCTTRTDVIEDEVLEALVKAGCKEISFGIESADQDVLNLLAKGTTVEQNLKAIKKAKEHGLVVRTLFMMGTPGETIDTPHKNINFLKEAKPDSVSLMTFAPFPASNIWNNPNKYNITILTKDFNKYTITSDPKDVREPLVAINGITIEQQKRNIMLLRDFLFSSNLINLG